MPLRFSTLARVTPPLQEVVSVGEIKTQLRLLHSEDDLDLEVLSGVAREWAEDFTSRALLYQSWLACYNGWPVVSDPTMIIPRGPLSVVEFVRYRDCDDALVELNEDEDFTVDEVEGSITFKRSFQFPSLFNGRANPVEIAFRAGYGDAPGDVPLRFKQAIRLWVASAYGIERNNDRAKFSFRAPSVAEVLLSNLRIRPL